MTWFELNPNKNDLDNVLNFIEQVPSNLDYLFEQSSFRELLDKDFDKYGISSELFFSAFKEAKEEIYKELEFFRGNGFLKQFRFGKFNYNPNLILEEIGFTGNSLILKANVLNKLWDGVIKVAEKAGGGVISFAINPIVKALRKFLTYLNSLLGSLKELIPGIDAIKEIKEVVESYLSIADE